MNRQLMQAQIKAARLYQRARLLQLAALELHSADLAVQSASCKALLEVFFLPFDIDDDTGEEHCDLCCGEPDQYVIYISVLHHPHGSCWLASC